MYNLTIKKAVENYFSICSMTKNKKRKRVQAIKNNSRLRFRKIKALAPALLTNRFQKGDFFSCPKRSLNIPNRTSIKNS